MSIVVRELVWQMLLLAVSFVGIWVVLVAAAGAIRAILCKTDLASPPVSRQRKAN
jgi:hypothetical protein